MYLTYDEYEDMGGTLDETTFDALYYEAESYINWVTFNRLKDDAAVPEEVKRCVFDLVNLINGKRSVLIASSTSTDNAAIKSMSNDGVSETYNIITPAELFTKINTEVTRTIKFYLSGVKNSKNRLVLYRGLYEDE